MIRVARLRHRSKTPELVPGARVEGASIAGDIPQGDLRRINTEHDDVLENERNSVPGLARIDKAILSECGIRLASRCFQCKQPLPDHDKNSCGMRAIAGPIGDTT